MASYTTRVLATAALCGVDMKEVMAAAGELGSMPGAEGGLMRLACTLGGERGRRLRGGGDAARTYGREDLGLSMALVDQWMDFAFLTLDPVVIAFLAGQSSARGKVEEEVLKTLEAHLGSRVFLCGDACTLGDVAVALGLSEMFAKVFGKKTQGAYPAVTRWWCTVAAACGGGGVELCEEEEGWKVPSSTSPAPTPSSSSTTQKGVSSEGENASLTEEEREKLRKKEAKKKEKDAKNAAKAAKLAAKKAKQAEQEKAEASNAKKKEKKKKEVNTKEKEEEERYLKKVLETPKGQKKDIGGAMPKAYSPKFVEAGWYSWWEESEFFAPAMETEKPPFVIVIPPPNVTGSLHLGHALTNAVQDAIVRWRRMSGYNALWVPGCDHAGIATQTVVEKKLMREQGIGRRDLGRAKFLEKVYEWKEQYGGRINMQLRRLGGSFDWSREAFTMDEKLSKAVNKAFLTMSRNGIIYRDNRLVNWCCRLKSAISDIEVDYIDIEGFAKLKVPGMTGEVEFGVLTSFAYPLEGGDGEIVVATTRPETMLGDTAVAVHPEDERYKHMQGKFLIHPFNGRRIPIITDSILVDMSFGTGAVKITPAHDPNDFATGQRHKLGMINVFTDDGVINEQGGKEFEGQTRFEARVKVVEALESKGLFRGKAPNPMRLGLCSRTKDIIEPMLKPQWWVDCKTMAAEACAAVRGGELKIVPSDFEKTWFNWLENIRDWCISRQLWWGHRIPAFYVTLKSDAEAHAPGGPSEKMERWIIAKDEEEARELAGEKYGAADLASLTQDDDVLDTWFSSGLFPFSTLGWPESTADMQKFYPNSLLETGHDILFFWVARMVMMGMHLTGKVPFHTVYLHAMVRDAHGRKMSKSLGNVIDPIQVMEGISLEGLHRTLENGNLEPKELKKAVQGQKADFPEGIEECGADALRFALCAYTSQARDINLDIKRVVAYRHWCNKLWNAIRFAMMNLGEHYVPSSGVEVGNLPVGCRWILSRLNAAVVKFNEAMEAYDFTTSTTAVYAFWQYEVCDVFIEISKPGLQEGASDIAAWRQTLWIVLETGLRLAHPFMPFVTEELWQRLPKVIIEEGEGAQTPKSIMLAQFPCAVSAWTDAKTEEVMALADAIVRSVRAVRAQYGLSKQKPDLYLVCADGDMEKDIASIVDYVKTLTTSNAVKVVAEKSMTPKGCAVGVVNNMVSGYLDVAHVLDPKAELQKLDKKMGEVTKALDALKKKMAMKDYVTKVPDKVKAENDARLEKFNGDIASMMKMKEDYTSMLG